MTHDPRRVRMHLATGDLVCFNEAHGPATLSTGERYALLADHGLTPELALELTGAPRWKVALAELWQAISELWRPVRCEP